MIKNRIIKLKEVAMKKVILILSMVLLMAGCGTITKTGNIEGKVLNKVNGSAIPNAVVWTAPPTSRVLTSADGSYCIEGIEPGTYTVFASASGFHTDSIRITVVAGKSAKADFMLEPGP